MQAAVASGWEARWLKSHVKSPPLMAIVTGMGPGDGGGKSEP